MSNVIDVSKADVVPKLVPGPGFHLEGDGHWDVQDIPNDILRSAEYSGEIKIDGYPAVVFETSSGDQWAQKAPGTPAPKGDEALKNVVSAFISDRYLAVAKRIASKTAKVDLERGQLRSVQGLLEELSVSKKALDKAVQYSRTLSNDSSLEWIQSQLETVQESLAGTATGIRESVEYLTRMDFSDESSG